MNFAKDALHVLGSVAPTLATAVAGPFGGMAVTAIESALGINKPPSTSPADAQKAIESALLGTDPTTLLALKNAENSFTEQMAQLGIDKDKLVFDDVASARTMQEQVKDPTVSELAWLVIGGFLLIAMFECVAMVFWPAKWAAIPAAALNLLGIIFGFMSSEAKQAGAFYFGSSIDSRNKTQALAEIAKS